MNTLTNVCNFILLRTQTDAFQFTSQFLILSNFSSLHYFKEFPLKLPKWEPDPFIFPFSICRAQCTPIFSTFTVMTIFPSISVAITGKHLTIINTYAYGLENADFPISQLTCKTYEGFFYFSQELKPSIMERSWSKVCCPSDNREMVWFLENQEPPSLASPLQGILSSITEASLAGPAGPPGSLLTCGEFDSRKGDGPIQNLTYAHDFTWVIAIYGNSFSNLLFLPLLFR